MKCSIAILLMTLSLFIQAKEITVKSDRAHYDGDRIILNGNVVIENEMGRIEAKKAVLNRDEKKTTQIDFPWIELNEEVLFTLPNHGSLSCDCVILNHIEKSSLFIGNPQVTYRDERGEIRADRTHIDYDELEGSFQPTQIILTDNVQLIHLEKEQYALADQIVYFPQEQLMILKGKESRVLFYDKMRDMQLSADTIHAKRDQKTQKERIQGVGDVRFIFGQEELEKLKERFHWSE